MAKVQDNFFVVIAICCLLSNTAVANVLQNVGGKLVDPSEPTVVYVASEFITMDAENPKVEAIAVKDGKFIAAGSLATVKQKLVELDEPDYRIDESLQDKVVVAGFIEQHVHPVLAALAMKTKVLSIEDWDAIDGFSPSIRDANTYQQKLRAAIQDHADKARPFITWGYHHYFHGPMSRDLLNKLAPDFPVIVWHRSAHEFFLNDKALEAANIDLDLIKTFTPTAQSQLSFEKGHFYEQGGMAILNNLAPLMATPEIFQEGLEFTEAYYHRNGITLACEPGGFYSKAMQQTVNNVYSDDATPFNHCFIGDGKSLYAIKPNDPVSLIAESEKILDWGEGRTWFLPNQIKLFTDGAIYSQLMQMQEGYTDGHHGAWIVDPEPFDFMFQTYWDAGYQIHVHNNGDAGMAVLLNSLEKAMKRNPRTDHRTVVVHFGFAKPGQVKRWIELGGIVSANPYYVTALAGHYAKFGIGPQRSQNMVPLGDVVKYSGSLSFHSDMPMAPAKPLQLMWSAVNRITAEGEVTGKQHRVSVDQALKAVTIDAAFSIQMESRVGSIEVGKDANLTVLEQSPYEVAPERLKDIEVWGTMLEGRLQPVPQEMSDSKQADIFVPADRDTVQVAVIEQLRKLSRHSH